MIKLQVRRDTAVNWTNNNPELLPGEIGFETDTGKLKIGRVSGQLWNDLAYISLVIGDHSHNITDINSFGNNVESIILNFVADSDEIIKTYHSQTDTISFTLSNTLSSPKTVSGLWTFNQVLKKRIDLGNISGTVNIDCSSASYFVGSITGPTTLTVSNVPAGNVVSSITLRITNGDTSVTWPASFKWDSGTAPTLTAAGKDIFTFITDDNGTTWYNVGQIIDVK
jgi:hypothetical protein